MIKRLTITQIAEILKSRPEQQIFDWKKDLHWLKEDDAKSKVIAKDKYDHG